MQCKQIEDEIIQKRNGNQNKMEGKEIVEEFKQRKKKERNKKKERGNKDKRE